MRLPPVLLTIAVAAAAQGLTAQTAQPTPEVGMQKPTPIEPLEIWQIDLNPSGTGFALTKPVEDGDAYVFKVWPDRATVRLPKSRIKKMVPRTKDVDNEILYRIEMLPTGEMYSRDVPTIKSGTYVFHAYSNGTLVSLRQADVKRVARLTGLDAFKAHLQQRGAAAIGNLPMEGGGTVSVIPSSEPSQPVESPSKTPSNWIYHGLPGVTDGWAPPSAVVGSPGDVPRAKPNR